MHTEINYFVQIAPISSNVPNVNYFQLKVMDELCFVIVFPSQVQKHIAASTKIHSEFNHSHEFHSVCDYEVCWTACGRTPSFQHHSGTNHRQ